MAKPTFSLEKGEHSVVLHVKGELTVQHARETKKTFQHALEEGSNMHLDLLDVVSFDISSVQLVNVLRAEVHRRGHQLQITWPQNADVIDLLEKCGIPKLI
jgi:anti-anti-sigma factor